MMDQAISALLLDIPNLVVMFHMKLVHAILVLVLGSASTFAQNPDVRELFQVGSYADDARTITCVSGEAGATFEHMVWAYVPDDLGLAYITLRFDFPANLDLATYRPDFNDLVADVIITDFAGGSVEWNMIFTECPSGWVKVFTHEIVILDGELSRIEILSANSMLRDCTFILNDLNVLNELVVNDPDCPTVPTTATTWSDVKSLY